MAYRIWVQVYDFFEKKTKLQVNRFMREGTLMKKYVSLFAFGHLHRC